MHEKVCRSAKNDMTYQSLNDCKARIKIKCQSS